MECNRYIPSEHLAEILEHLSGDDHLIVDLLLWTGYRCDDVVHLRGRNLRGNRLTVREQKTGNLRSVDLSPELADRLRAKVHHPNAYLWRCRQPRPGRRRKMHRTTLYRHWMEAVKSAGMEGHGYTLHSLRKVYAVDALRRLGTVDAVQTDLAHKSKSTTLLYALSDVL